MHLYKLLIKKYLIKNKYITRKENFRFTSIKKDDQYYLAILFYIIVFSYTKCPIHSSRSPGRKSITGTSTIV